MIDASRSGAKFWPHMTSLTYLAIRKSAFFHFFRTAKIGVSCRRELNFRFFFLKIHFFFEKWKSAKSSWRHRKSTKIVIFWMPFWAERGFGRKRFLRDVPRETHVFRKITTKIDRKREASEMPFLRDVSSETHVFGWNFRPSWRGSRRGRNREKMARDIDLPRLGRLGGCMQSNEVKRDSMQRV